MAGHEIPLYNLLNDNDFRDFEATEPTRHASTPHADFSSGLTTSHGGDHLEPELAQLHEAEHALENEVFIAAASPHLTQEVIAAASNPVSSDGQLCESPDPKHARQGDLETKDKSLYLNVLSWWVPEPISSALSVASFASIVAVLLAYDRCAVARLGMPIGLTLNGIVALLATVGRVCLCAPVCSALLQEMWL